MRDDPAAPVLEFCALLPGKSAEEAAEFCAALANRCFGTNFTARDVSVLGFETESEADRLAAAELGAVIRPVCRGKLRQGSAALFAEPELIPLGTPAARAEKGLLLLLLENGERIERDGEPCELLERIAPAALLSSPTEVDNSDSIRPYYIRFSGESGGWLDIVTRGTLGGGVVTMPVSAKAAHNWMEHALSYDREAFAAGVFAPPGKDVSFNEI